MRERIGTAQLTRNLSERPPEVIAAVDVIRACGLAARSSPLGLAIWRWRVAGQRRELPEIVAGLVSRGFNPDVVRRALVHLADDACPECSGRGYHLIPGSPSLSDAACAACAGTGRRPLPDAAAQAVIEVVLILEREFAGEVMRRLARDTEPLRPI